MFRKVIGCICMGMAIVCGFSAGGLYAIPEKVYQILGTASLVGVINFAIIGFIVFFLIKEKE